MSKKTTQLVHLGRVSGDAANAVNPPLVRASTTTFPSLAEFKNSYKGVTFETPRYGRSGTSTVFELQTAMAALCETESCIATSSGLGAVAAVIGAHAAPGNRILIQDCVYGPTRVLAEKELDKLGSEVVFFDTLDALESHLDERTALVFIEVPGSLTMDMIDVEAVCKLAKHYSVPVACDSSWGTPLFFDAHGLGINISIHAATKYIGGHSDIMLGLITGSYDDLSSTRDWCAHYGSTAAPDVCWLGLRGLRTLDVRMRRHEENARHVAQWLQGQPQIKKILNPALDDDPGHELWKRQFTGGAGPFTIELVACSEEEFAKLIDSLSLFGLGTSWGGFESLVMPAIAHHLRALDVLPNEGRLLRLHIGLEHSEDLCADIGKALAHISATRPMQN
ncbi:PLP-dependent transferase [Rhodobacteraceae bacterium B1Z28]|uniref:PLP-dependent transferase n=1 Tax=Ruegeria haliotis TaxID=2747601 RepID=A0ABX2PTQ5_9RHOB|nr:PLP-dependent aspartate aminotransferase family protein [Ruegeria haliotis]NVO56932.1 PLP-dependent transferase [Ruegeria haliotis]